MTGREQVLKQVREALAAVGHAGTVDANGVDAAADRAAVGTGSAAAEPAAANAVAGGGDAAASAAPETPAASTAWDYGRPTAVEDVIGLFIERVEDYKAHVIRVAVADVPVHIAACLAAAQAKTVVLPPGLDASWADALVGQGIKTSIDAPPLSKLELDQTDAVVTAACVGMAETGTIVLDHQPDQGRRIISLLPDTHVCVIRADQIATDVPEAMARLSSRLGSGRPLTWISGPSATSDIELERVEGVHGPRQLYVIVAE